MRGQYDRQVKEKRGNASHPCSYFVPSNFTLLWLFYGLWHARLSLPLEIEVVPIPTKLRELVPARIQISIDRCGNRTDGKFACHPAGGDVLRLPEGERAGST